MSRFPPEAAPLPLDEVDYPDTDPDAMPENPPHFFALVALVAVVRQFFSVFPNVYVVGDVFWYYEKGNPKARKAPDLMVIKGVDPKTQRHSFKSWEHGGAHPCFILEILSKRTAEEDKEDKRWLYERLGVEEYFLFDAEGELLDQPLVGYRLVNGAYVELQPQANGRLLSEELGLWLVAEDDTLVFIDRQTGERLRDLPETSRLVEEVREELEEARMYLEQERQHAQEAELEASHERQRAEEARQQAEQQKQRAQQEEQRAMEEKQRAEKEGQRAVKAEQRAEQERRRAEELEAELARLRAEQSPSSSPPEATS